MESTQTQKTGKEIELLPLFRFLLKKVWLMALVGLVVAGIFFGVSKAFIEPVYRCGFSAYVNNRHAQTEKNVLTSSDLLASQHLTKTFNHIILSNSVLSASLDSVNSNLSYGEFRSMVSTSIQDDTELISVYVVNKDPQLAYVLARAVAETAPKYIADIVDGSSMKIVDYPVYTKEQYNPPQIKYTVLGFLLGAVVVALIYIFHYFMNDTINDISELEEHFELPILGVLPDINQLAKVSYGSHGGNYSHGYSSGKTQKG